MALASATARVIDLTATNGLEALARLLPEARLANRQRWRAPLRGLGRAVNIDWQKPPELQALPARAPDGVGTWLLLGPGSQRLLPGLLARCEDEGERPGLLLMPTALMESLWLRAERQAGRWADLRVMQLPTSDPQVIWMVLLELIDRAAQDAGAPPPEPSPLQTGDPMSSNLKQSIDQAMTIEGAMLVALVDHRSGMCLAHAGTGLNVELAAAGNTEVVRAKLKTIESLGLRGAIEDILITLQNQYHLIRLIPNHPGLFLYLVLDKTRGNLALARYRLTEIERGIKV